MKKMYVFAAVLQALLLTACSSDENLESDELIITADMDVTNGGVSTRSLVTGSAFASDSTIGVFITGTGYTPAATVFTYSGSSWTGASSIYLTGNTATVYGYYPSGLTPNTTAITVPVTVTTTLSENAFSASANAQADYMYAVETGETTQETVTKSASGATLTFKHALSELTFIVNKSAEFGGAGNLTNITLTKTTGTFPGGIGAMSLTDGTLSLSTVGSISLTNSTGVSINAASGTTATATALVAPTTLLNAGSTSDVTLSMIIDGFTYTKTLPITTVSAWTAGNNYSYTVTVAGGTLTITSVAITDWTSVAADGVTIE